MDLNNDICYQAVLTHDRRFDGVFFVGVKSTHIYCRTVCTAKTPALRSCTFFAGAAAAELAGFRPCLRCRPELAPGLSRVDSTGRLAAAISRRIEDGALSEMSINELANELEISERHLRRIVNSEFGVSPLELAQTQRLLLAKQLLTDSALPVTEIAFASGFNSIRRFNAIFKESYGLNPTQLRKGSQSQVESDIVECDLGYRPPLDWQALFSFLSARNVSGVESFADGRYRRAVRVGDKTGWLEVIPNIEKHKVRVRIAPSLSRAILPILTKVRRQFDLNADPFAISAHLGELSAKHPGLRVPGAFDGFEMAVRAILGQQVSVKGATTLMTRLVTAYGEPCETPFPEIGWLFPRASVVAEIDIDELCQTVHMPHTRGVAINALAQAVASGHINLDHGSDLEATLEKLKALPGIGEWTAQYIAMRALNWPDAFPHSDLGIYKAMNERNPKLVLAAAEVWRPWRAYAAIHLWKSLETV